MLTALEAAQRLLQSPDDYATPDALMALAAQVSVAPVNGQPTDRTVLYSGGVDNGEPKLDAWTLATGMQKQEAGVLIIDVTERGAFLVSKQFKNAVLRAFASEGHLSYADVMTKRDSKANQFLFDAENGAWAQASKSFAESLEGEVVTLTSQAQPNRTFGLVELPALLANPKVKSVNGVARTVLAQLAEQPNGQAFVFKALAESSKAMLNQCGLVMDEQLHIAHIDTTPMLGRSKPPPTPQPGLKPPRQIQAGAPDTNTLNTLKKATRVLKDRWLERVLGVKRSKSL
jgi:hypothetical protein